MDIIKLEINEKEIELYRPIYTINSNLIKNAENINIGHKQVYSITDTILINDRQPSAPGDDETPFFLRYGTLLDSASKGALSKASITVNGREHKGIIKNINIASDTDFITKFKYTIDIETAITNIIDGIYSDIFLENDLSVSSISETKNFDIPTNLTAIRIPLPTNWDDIRNNLNFLNTGSPEFNDSSGIYYSDTIKYSYDISFRCDVGVGIDSDIAADLIYSRIQPLDYFTSGFGLKTPILISATKSSAGDGTKTLSLKYETVPADASGYMTLKEEITRKDNSKDFYANRSYKITAKPAPNEILIHSGNSEDTEQSIPRQGPFPYDITGTSRASVEPRLLVNTLKEFFVNGLSGIKSVNGDLIKSHDRWRPDIPLDKSSKSRCGIDTSPKILLNSSVTGLDYSRDLTNWQTKSMVITQDLNNGTASLFIDQTTQDIGMCKDYSYKIKFDIKKTDEKVINHIPSWKYSGYIIQDNNTWKQSKYDYTIDVEYLLMNNPDSGMTNAISKAKDTFEDIDICSGTGHITDYIINSTNNKCTLKITQYSGIGA